MNPRHVLYGLVFGFLLTRIGATDYDAIAGMFRLADLHLLGVIGLAVVANAAGFALLRKRQIRSASGAPLAMATKPMVPGLLTGALVFGSGWAIAGTCPGTALAMIGEGKLSSFATFTGILLGAWLAARPRPARPV